MIIPTRQGTFTPDFEHIYICHLYCKMISSTLQAQLGFFSSVEFNSRCVDMKNLARCIFFMFLACLVIFHIYYNSSKFPVRKYLLFSGPNLDEQYFIFENNSLIRLWIDVPNSFPWRKCFNVYRSLLYTYTCQKTYQADKQLFTVITRPGDESKFSLHHKELET